MQKRPPRGSRAACFSNNTPTLRTRWAGLPGEGSCQEPASIIMHKSSNTGSDKQRKEVEILSLLVHQIAQAIISTPILVACKAVRDNGEKMQLLSVTAWGCRYLAPVRHQLLNFTRRRYTPRHRLPLSAVLSCDYCNLPNPNIYTGNSLFRCMERFWTGSGINQNKGMVEHLKQYGVIKSEKVTEVMAAIDRASFVPEGTPPYVDTPMQIGYNVTISAPHMHAMCLELLEEHLKPGMHALDVGSGTGYLTACFAVMVGPEGRAVGVEHIPELVSSSIKNIQKSAAAQLLKQGSLLIHAGDGRLGWPEFAPYDAIHVGAAAVEIPPALLEQLKPGGRMVIPVGNIYQDLQVVDKELDGSIRVRTETSVRYVPLTSREAQLRGY